MSSTAHLTCQELVELVTDYLEGALPTAEKTRFEDHIQQCEGCRGYLSQMRATIQVTGHLSEDNIKPTDRDEMLNVFRHWKQGQE